MGGITLQIKERPSIGVKSITKLALYKLNDYDADNLDDNKDEEEVFFFLLIIVLNEPTFAKPYRPLRALGYPTTIFTIRVTVKYSILLSTAKGAPLQMQQA